MSPDRPQPTATTAGARAHARAQEQAARNGGFPHRPTVPAADDDVPGEVVWAEQVAPGGYAHRLLAAGTAIRLTDTDGDACASLLLHHADMPWERLNVADTVKVQWQVYTAAGQLLLSDQARVLASVVGDTSGRHDTLYGTSAQARNEQRYGDGSPEGASPAGRELFLLGASKYGLGRRDLPPSISFFQGVRISAGGRPEWLGSAGPGTTVTLRTELPVIVLIANAAHPLDPRPAYTSSPLRITAWRDRVTSPDDDLWNATPEGRRAFENTADHRRGRGLR